MSAKVNERPSIEQSRLERLCAGSDLSDDARGLMRKDMEPLAYVRLLQERALFSDAISVLARLFSKRESVWWGCQCVRQSVTETALPRSAEAALAAAETWVADPNDENRRVLFTISQEAGLDTAAGLAAMAAFGSGGSMMPPEFDPVPPHETMTAELVAASVLMAGVAEDPDTALEKYRMFLEQGIVLCEQSDENA